MDTLYGHNKYPSQVKQRVDNGRGEQKSELKSSELGSSIHVPRISSMGVMPIRTNTNQYGDSNNHLMYLR